MCLLIAGSDLSGETERGIIAMSVCVPDEARFSVALGLPLTLLRTSAFSGESFFLRE